MVVMVVVLIEGVGGTPSIPGETQFERRLKGRGEGVPPPPPPPLVSLRYVLAGEMDLMAPLTDRMV